MAEGTMRSGERSGEDKQKVCGKRVLKGGWDFETVF